MSHDIQQSFSGKLDELRIYNRALNQEDINGIYNEQIAGINTLNEIDCTLKIFPNPNNGFFEINFKTKEKSNLIIGIYNSIGQCVFKNYFQNNQDEFSREIDLRNLPEGLYHISIVIGNKTISKEISIIK